MAGIEMHGAADQPESFTQRGCGSSTDHKYSI